MSIEKFAEAMKGMIISSAMTSYAQGRNFAVFQEYLNMGLSEEEAHKAMDANISPDVLRTIMYSKPIVFDDTLSFINTRYGIMPSQRKQIEIPKPKRRKNRMSLR